MFVHSIHSACVSSSVCVWMRERPVHCWGGEGGGVCVCSERAPFNYCVTSRGGTFYEKIIYCPSFVYLEKRLKLFVALSSSGWLSVGYHCHLLVPKNLEAAWSQMWPLPSPSQNPIPRPLPPEEGSLCTETWPSVMSPGVFEVTRQQLLGASGTTSASSPEADLSHVALQRETHNECLAVIS